MKKKQYKVKAYLMKGTLDMQQERILRLVLENEKLKDANKAIEETAHVWNRKYFEMQKQIDNTKNVSEEKMLNSDKRLKELFLENAEWQKSSDEWRAQYNKAEHQIDEYKEQAVMNEKQIDTLNIRLRKLEAGDGLFKDAASEFDKKEVEETLDAARNVIDEQQKDMIGKNAMIKELIRERNNSNELCEAANIVVRIAQKRLEDIIEASAKARTQHENKINSLNDTLGTAQLRIRELENSLKEAHAV